MGRRHHLRAGVGHGGAAGLRCRMARQRIQAEAAQHARQRDQRQADDGGGVVAPDAVHQRDAQAFGLGAACGIVGLLGAQVGVDGRIGQRAETAQRDNIRCFRVHAVGDGHGAVEFHGAPGQPAQLFAGALEPARLADGFAVDGGHLVRADHHAARVGGGHGHRLGDRQAQRQVGGRFARLWRFVHIGRNGGKRQAQAGQQLAAIARARCEDQLWRNGGHALFDDVQ
ncbi:Uncharacterised protein [Bordetella pertussis]|nr:Uncharacterised protein [Bordetella pertussis]